MIARDNREKCEKRWHTKSTKQRQNKDTMYRLGFLKIMFFLLEYGRIINIAA